MTEKIDIPLVISDYIMPNMNGDEFLKRIYHRSPQTMKILLTGQATIEGVANSINYARLYRYIPKPWEKTDLQMAITEAVKSYDQDKTIEKQNQLLEQQNEKLRHLYAEQQKLTDAFAETMVSALDQRDTTTAGHSKRMAKLAIKLGEAINRIDTGKFKDVHFSEDQLKEIYYAALLHDVGKIGVRENVLLKQHRLTEENQRAIRYKFKYFKLMLEMKKNGGEISGDEQDLLDDIEEFLKFVLKLSKTYFLSDEDEQKLRNIGKIAVSKTNGQNVQLLEEYELENLLIKNGNLTKAERKMIESHASYTYDLLKSIPWPKSMSNLPKMAASHHEKIDGSGYFWHLQGDGVLLETRMLAMLDIFEALTSADRPYKKPLSPENALRVIEEEVEKGTLDKDVYEIFVREGIYALKI